MDPRLRGDDRKENNHECTRDYFLGFLCNKAPGDPQE